jgi:hypothetical protein
MENCVLVFQVASRVLIRDGGAVPPLALLLAGTDVQAQVCSGPLTHDPTRAL